MSTVNPVELGDFARLVARTLEVFGNPEQAVRWLKTANLSLGGDSPLRVYQRAGSAKVEEVLIAIEHGICA